MSPEISLDLNNFAKERSFEVMFPSEENGEYEPTVNLIPLTFAVDIGLAKIVQAEDENFYVVTPTKINTSHENYSSVAVVDAERSEKVVEKEITSYIFTTCTSCGGSLTDESTEKIMQEQIHCRYCGMLNQNTSSQTEKIDVREIEVENIYEANTWIGTVEDLMKEYKTPRSEKLTLWEHIKQLFSISVVTAPLEVIQAGRDLVSEEQKIIITGPFSDFNQKDFFVRIGELQTISGKGEEERQPVNRGERYPKIPPSYLVEEFEEISDDGDNLLIIESESGNKLPLVVMTDRDGNPSRFVVPLNALQYGWTIIIESTDVSLNQVIAENTFLLNTNAPNSMNTIPYGRVKVFYWNYNNSERHDQITDMLNNNNFEIDELNISADIPNGDVSALFIEHTG
jgi:hypothetical protein